MFIANPGTYLPNLHDERKFGLDLSGNQSLIDFVRMASPFGFPKIEFVACRTGISWAYKDSWFETYWRALGGLNVARLAYHVLYPAQPIISQVENMASRFPDKKFDGDAVVNDVELVHDVSPTKLSEATYEFTNRMQDWAKKPVLIYTRYSFITSHMDYWSNKYKTWMEQQKWWMAWYYGKTFLGQQILAEYPTDKMIVPVGLEKLKVVIHQTGERGDGKKVGTTSQKVDTNRWIRGEEEFNSFFKKESLPPINPSPILDNDEKVRRLWLAHPELHT